MDQDIGSEVQADPAAVAFEALRREAALLNVALGGLAVERASAPNYRETLAGDADLAADRRAQA